MSALNRKEAPAQSITPVRLTSRKPRPRPRKKGPFLLGAVVVLLVAALTVQSFGVSFFGDDEAAGPSSASGLDSSASDPILDVPASTVAATQVIDVVDSSLDDTIAQAHGSVQAAIDDAHAELAATASLYGGLPALPSDYVAGMDVSSYIGTVSSASYYVPELNGHVQGLMEVAASWSEMPSQIPAPSQLLPADPTEALDEVGGLDGLDGLGELDAVFGALEEHLGEDVLGSTFEELTGGLGEGLPVPLPTDPFADADPESTAQPHEEGARAAYGHADALISEATGVFSDISGDAEVVLEQSSQLIGAIDGTFASLDSQVHEVETSVRAIADQRVAATLEDVASTQAQLQAAADAHVASLDSQLASLQSTVDAQVESQTSLILDAAAEQQAALDATIDAVKADAEFRIDAIQTSTAGLLEIQEAAGASTATLQATLDESVEALDGVRADTRVSLDLLNAAKADVQASADAAVADLESMAFGSVSTAQSLVASATSETSARLDFAMALASETASAFVDAHLEKAESTVTDLHLAAAAKKEFILETAVELNERGLQALQDVESLVGGVQEEASAEVWNDLDYIQKVAEDYSTVPLPDREKRAAYWNSVHSTVQGQLGGTLNTGSQAIESLGDAQAVVEGNLLALQARL